jgi:hypothetical protein
MITTIQQRINDILYDNFDSYSGSYVTLNKVTRYWDGSTMTDAKCDGVIYFKSGSEYFKRSYENQIDVRWYGALGDNTANDTAAIQSAIDACPVNGTVVIYEDMICRVNTLQLKSNLTFLCLGKLIQVTADNLQVFNRHTQQNSSYPLLLASGISNVNIQMSCQTNYEALFAVNSSHITVCKSNLDGNLAPGGFAGIMMFQCNHINIRRNAISRFGQQRTDVGVYKDGTGIRALTIDHLTIENNRIHDNAENGVFTIACRHVKIDQNEISANGLSGIQVAFQGGTEHDYLITNNKIHHNMADAIDINNGDSIVDLKAVISGNVCSSNGFVGSASTPDGSGIATLIRVTNVLVENNETLDCNKGAFYMYNCGTIITRNNTCDRYMEIVGTFDHIEVRNNIFGGSINVITGAAGKFLNIQGNSFTLVSLPNGIVIDQLLIQENRITECGLNFNITGSVLFARNRTTNAFITGTNTFYISSVSNGLTIENNIIEQSSNADCINITAAVSNIRIVNNCITGKNILINDAGSPYLVVEGNKLTALAGGYIPARTFSGNPVNAHLRNNSHDSPSNTIKIASGTLFLDHENFITGFADYGTATVKTVVYS